MPRVSVIIPVRDDPRIVACLAALQRQTYPADLIEVVVVDNGSVSPPEDLTGARPGVLQVSEPQGGSYAARNAGVSASTGSVLAFTDADCLPEEDWLEQVVAALRAGAGVVAGHVSVYARDNARPNPVEAYELVHAFPQETYVGRGGAGVTANLSTTREVFEAAGPFRSELYSGADIEWSQRANSRGITTLYAPTAVVHHPARDSFGALNTKLHRVIAGRFERDALEGGPSVAPWPTLRSLVPPLGALRRARSPQLLTARARAAFVVGEFYHRYAAAWHHLSLARSSRRAHHSSHVRGRS